MSPVPTLTCTHSHVTCGIPLPVKLPTWDQGCCLYHLPSTHSQIQWVNQEIKQFLCLLVNQRQDDWSNWASIAKFAYNNLIHT